MIIFYIMIWIVLFLVYIIEGICGVWFRYFTPKFDISFGFRTSATCASENCWKFAHKKLGSLWIFLSIIQIICFTISIIFVHPKNFFLNFTLISFFISVLVIFVSLFVVHFWSKRIIEKEAI